MTGLWKLTPLITLLAVILMIAAAVSFGIYVDRDYREQKEREARIHAEILASSISASLAFNDSTAATDYVDAMRADPQIIMVAVYDAHGSLFTSFHRVRQDVPTEIESGTTILDEGRLGVAVPVVRNDLHLGTVYIEIATRSFTQRAVKYAHVVIVGLAIIVILIVLGIGQAVVNRANAELQRRARDLSETNERLQQQNVQRERAEEALRHSQKMESLGQLTGGVAHDFNNLLAIILGNLERVERQMTQGISVDRQRKAIANAKAGAERAAALTRSLLVFSRRQPLRPEPVDLNHLLNGTTDLLSRTLGEQIAVESKLEEDLWPVLIDSNQLESAILNLAVNARDAMADGGTLTIQAKKLALPTEYTDSIEELEPGDYVALSFIDTGTGMDGDVIARAFEPFFTTKDVGHGTGLGLSQVYGLVRQSGGHVAIESEKGKGTAITLYLTKLAEVESLPLDRDKPHAGTQPEAGNRSETVLVVEDDDAVRDHSAALLAELGCRVFEARESTEALSILNERSDISLLFTDLGLPGGMNGQQLAEEARERWPQLRILFTTGYANSTLLSDSRIARGMNILTKPFTYAELSEAVNRMLDQDNIPPTHVLVVEDDALLRMTTVDCVEELGFTTLEAATAKQALALLRENAARIAVTLTDLSLPDRRGDHIVADLQVAAPDIPIIVTSGSDKSVLGEQYKDDERIAFLPKPCTLQDFEHALAGMGVKAPPRAAPATSKNHGTS